MGLTNQYLKYIASGAQFAQICSGRCNPVYVNLYNEKGRYVAVGGCENVFIYDTVKKEKVKVLARDQQCQVTCLDSSEDRTKVAVGYTDGYTQVFDLAQDEEAIFFSSNSGVSTVSFDSKGMRLATGHCSGEIAVVDLVDNKGVARFGKDTDGTSKGHKDIVTKLYFSKKKNVLISSSKDCKIKFWNLDVLYCGKTLSHFQKPVWQFVVNDAENTLITGSDDTQLRVYDMQYVSTEENTSTIQELSNEENDDNIKDRIVKLTYKQTLEERASKKRVHGMYITKDQKYMVVHGPRKVEFYSILNEEEVVEKLKKKKKKLAKKRKAEECNIIADKNVDVNEVELDLKEKITYKTIFNSKYSIASMTVLSIKNEVTITCVSQKNLIHSHVIDVEGKDNSSLKEVVIQKHGHRSESKSACFSSDDKQFITTSALDVKVWNRSSKQCTKTFDCEQPTCSLFVQGNGYIIIGTQKGNLMVYSLLTGQLVHTFEQAHKDQVTGITLLKRDMPYGDMASVGLDKRLVVYEFELSSDEKSNAQLLKVKKKSEFLFNGRILDLKAFTFMNEEDQSKNIHFYAVSLDDLTIKIVYADSFNEYKNLYGMSLVCDKIDTSYDGHLLVAGCRDRNCYIFHTEFGDLVRKIFAHDNQITHVQFVPQTHMYWSCARDGDIKLWDADRFIKVQCLKVAKDRDICVNYAIPSNDGEYMLASTTNPLAMRLYEKSSETIIPEEEEMHERDLQADKDFADNYKNIVPGEFDVDEQLASKKTPTSIGGAEGVMDAVDLYRKDKKAEREFYTSVKDVKPKPKYKSSEQILLIQKITAAEWVLECIKKIRSSELEQSFLIIPFSYLQDLLELINQFLEKEVYVELVWKCAFLLLRIHHRQIVSSKSLLNKELQKLQSNRKILENIRDRIGYNKSALEHVRSIKEEKDEVSIFQDLTNVHKDKKRKKKKREALKIR